MKDKRKRIIDKTRVVVKVGSAAVAGHDGVPDIFHRLAGEVRAIMTCRRPLS